MVLAGNLFISTPNLPAVQNVGLDAASSTSVAAISACDADAKSKECVIELINKYADQYDVSAKLALDIANCESELKTTAIGDSGKAYGVYQFHKPTFQEFSKKFGDETLNYHDTEDNIQLAIWALAHNKGYHWSCYRKIAAK